MNRQEFVDEIARLRPGSTFLVLHKYRNSHGEVADFNIIFHMSYKNALKKSIAIVERFKPTNTLQERAQLEVLVGYQNSLHRIETTPIEDIDDAYFRYKDEEGKFIDGVKLHLETGYLHLFGLAHLKRIITPCAYKKVNSSQLTIEKNKIRNLTPASKFRQFRLHNSQVEKIKVQHISLLPPTSLR